MSNFQQSTLSRECSVMGWEVKCICHPHNRNYSGKEGIQGYSVSVLALTFPITKPKLVDHRITAASRDSTNSTSSGWISWWSLKREFSHKSLMEGALRRWGARKPGREGEQLSKGGLSRSPVSASAHRNSGANAAQQSPSYLCILG